MRRRLITTEEAERWKKFYEENEDATILSTALEFEVSLGTMRKWLNKVGTNMKTTGQRQPSKVKYDGVRGIKDGAVPKFGNKTARTGHRRRGF